MGMIILITFLLLGVIVNARFIFTRPKPIKIDNETKKTLTISMFLSLLIPATFTIWGTLLIGSKNILMATCIYLIWHIIDFFKISKQAQDAIAKDKEEFVSRHGFFERFMQLVESVYLAYLIWCLYLIM